MILELFDASTSKLTPIIVNWDKVAFISEVGPEADTGVEAKTRILFPGGLYVDVSASLHEIHEMIQEARA
jgi:hypothetical protein